MSARTPHDHDVVIVGSRVAGAATAMLLARQGIDVLVVDRAEFPSDALSTHGLSRGGVVQLARWGLLDRVVASGAPAIRRVSMHSPLGEPRVKNVESIGGVDHLLAPRRYVLDSILLHAAREGGAAALTGVSVTDLLTGADGAAFGVRLRDHDDLERDVTARFVVGADGVRSSVARWVGAPKIVERPASGATYYAYVAGIDGDDFEFHAADGGFAGFFRTHDDEAAVFVCIPVDRALHGAESRRDGYLSLLSSVAPSLASRVTPDAIATPVRAMVGAPNYIRRAAGPGWALVGDASAHRDPITGHGITDAFRDAELLARYLGRAMRNDTDEHDVLRSYDIERYRRARPVFDVTTELVTYPPLARFVELQRELGRLIEHEAIWLASQPLVTTRDVAAA